MTPTAKTKRHGCKPSSGKSVLPRDRHKTKSVPPIICVPCRDIGGVGSAFEPTAEHTARHDNCRKHPFNDGGSHKSGKGGLVHGSCVRCVFSHCQVAIHKATKIPGHPGCTWVEEKPAYMGGKWGLGCRICAWYLASQVLVVGQGQVAASKCAPSTGTGDSRRRHINVMPTRRRGNPVALMRQTEIIKWKWQHENASKPRFNKFARFAFPGAKGETTLLKKLLQKLRAHGCWACHKEAERAFFIHQQKGPTPCVAQGLSPGWCANGNPKHDEAKRLSSGWCANGNPKHDEAKRLLAGRVPTAQDWRDALIECEEGVSMRRGARMSSKRKADHHTNISLDRATSNQRKMRRQQYRVMAEVVRSDARAALRKATSCTMSLDGSAGNKVVRFRCDGQQAPWFKDGVVGLLDENVFKDLGEFTVDHASRGALKFDELLARFCTPWGAELDQDLKDHIQNIVHVVSADGCAAERRAMHLVAERAFANFIELIRDPAHAIRIAMKVLHKDDFFKEMWDELFENKHSLVSSWGLPVQMGGWLELSCFIVFYNRLPH